MNIKNVVNTYSFEIKDCAENVNSLSCDHDINIGLFIYTLDDPYIHLAVSENIMLGGYGVNPQEFSAPSSSIIWPYLIVLVSLLSFNSIPLEMIPLLINILSAFLSIIIASLHINKIFARNASLVNFLFFIFLIVGTNIVGLIFIGMEHSLQVLILMAISYRVIHLKKNNDYLLYSLLIIAPLIRYENIAITFSIIGYLFFTHDKKQSILLLLLTLLPILLFSFYLYKNGAGFLPTSILIKSGALSDSFTLLFLNKIFDNLSGSLTFTILYFLAIYTMFKKNSALLTSLVVSMTLHLLFGRTGWFHRYEMYIIAYSSMFLLYFYKDLIQSILLKYKMLSISGFIVFIIFINFVSVYHLSKTDMASNNIYMQQNLMGEIARAYNKPVAVNDLGLVSFKNDNYVLDLYGLSSKEAMIARLEKDTGKQEELVEKYNVGLIMVYDNWFDEIPNNWEKIGSLKEDGPLIAPIGEKVSFYITGIDDENVIELLKKFKRIGLVSPH